jgi:hypothetical protein
MNDDLEGSGRCLIKAPSRHLPGVIEKNHSERQVVIVPA